MSNTVYFLNDAEFDPTAMLTFGVSAKESNNAIGFFGTGFKYAVAIILKTGGSIKVYSHGNEYVFEKRTETIRGKDFDVVYMNGHNAGFTTHLGSQWLSWMAFRELYANCKDEAGTIQTDEPKPFDWHGKTVIEVDSTEIHRAYLERDTYFIEGEPDHVGRYVDIYKKPSSYIFYKGVAVYSIDSAFTFNVKTHVSLSEERTAKYTSDWAGPVGQEVQAMTDVGLMTAILTSENKTDRDWSYRSENKMSDQFVSNVKMLLSADRGVAEGARLCVKEMEEKAGDFPEYHLTKTELLMLERATQFLNDIGVNVTEFPINTVTGLGNNVMGRAIESKIYVAPKAFQMGTKQVASTLLEEWVHCKYGCVDFDRDMQNWLFDKVLSIGEEMRGEPI